jgi:hypothetical protein
MRTTLLDMVQSILSDMDSEEVNSISDSVEAEQIANVIKDTYFNIIAAREIPEHQKILRLVSLSDSTRPTHFLYPDDIKSLEELQYNVGTVAAPSYKDIAFVEPFTFLKRMPENGKQVGTVADGIPLYVHNDKAPSMYTSFDDEHIIMDAYDASVEPILQASKTRGYGSVYPTFTIEDSFEPDLDSVLLPMLLAESKSVCFSLFKSGSDPKVEQAARRLKSYVQNDMYKTKRENKRPRYGR